MLLASVEESMVLFSGEPLLLLNFSLLSMVLMGLGVLSGPRLPSALT